MFVYHLKNHSIGFSKWKAPEAGWTFFFDILAFGSKFYYCGASVAIRVFEIARFCWGASAESYRMVLAITCSLCLNLLLLSTVWGV